MAAAARATVVVRRSRFVADVTPVTDEATALAWVADVRRREPQATHHVFAFRVGHPNLVERYSDDGEPAGTAGRPVLDVLQQRGLVNVACVVTRYFGGTLLGAPGLVRAYRQAALAALEASALCTWRLHRRLRVRVGYGDWGAVEARLRQAGGVQRDVRYGEDVEAVVEVPAEACDRAVASLREITAGSARIAVGEALYRPVLAAGLASGGAARIH
ncbi:MAG: YigZ family protein [Clostridia bacterium]|nr:YigZ family protein [Clostridia bacterium]